MRLLILLLLSGCSTLEPPHRAGVVCPEGFCEYEYVETVLDNEADTNRHCQALQDEHGGVELARYRGCTVDTEPRQVVYTRGDIATRDYERARAACPSLGEPSFALITMREQMERHDRESRARALR